VGEVVGFTKPSLSLRLSQVILSKMLLPLDRVALVDEAVELWSKMLQANAWT